MHFCEILKQSENYGIPSEQPGMLTPACAILIPYAKTNTIAIELFTLSSSSILLTNYFKSLSFLIENYSNDKKLKNNYLNSTKYQSKCFYSSPSNLLKIIQYDSIRKLFQIQNY